MEAEVKDLRERTTADSVVVAGDVQLASYYKNPDTWKTDSCTQAVLSGEYIILGPIERSR
jgi:hypothetical protein